MLEERLANLKNKIIDYGLFAEEMIEKSINGLLNNNRPLLLEVIEKDEPKANELELEFDELCITLIVQYSPKAKDLRTVLMVLKINNDLERICDLAVNICESALFLIEREPVKPFIDIPKMADITMQMLKDSINSFINEDTVLAKSICKRDDIVDKLRDNILSELITYMVADPNTIERATHLIRISRSLERIADYSTNIAEDVIFMVEGLVIKHRKNLE